MKRSKHLVVVLPLAELWSDGPEFREGMPLEFLNCEQITILLRYGPVRFVIADVGEPLLWIRPDECYDFWKREVKPHLADPDTEIVLSGHPDEYAYIARRWATEFVDAVIVLEKHH